MEAYDALIDRDDSIRSLLNESRKTREHLRKLERAVEVSNLGAAYFLFQHGGYSKAGYPATPAKIDFGDPDVGRILEGLRSQADKDRVAKIRHENRTL